MTNIAMERSTMFNGNIHDFYGQVQYFVLIYQRVAIVISERQLLFGTDMAGLCVFFLILVSALPIIVDYYQLGIWRVGD